MSSITLRTLPPSYSCPGGRLNPSAVSSSTAGVRVLPVQGLYADLLCVDEYDLMRQTLPARTRPRPARAGSLRKRPESFKFPFSEQHFLGKMFVLNNTKFWVDKRAATIEWTCVETGP